jgi:predicted ABC-type ATPase
VLRVRTRFQQGGHDVPRDKILSRREKSHANLWKFAEFTDLTLIFDNSDVASPVLIAERAGGRWTVRQLGRLPDLDPVLETLANA